MAAVAPLTTRQWQVARLVARGASVKKIARALGISWHTAHNHLAHIRRKVGGGIVAITAYVLNQRPQ